LLMQVILHLSLLHMADPRWIDASAEPAYLRAMFKAPLGGSTLVTLLTLVSCVSDGTTPVMPADLDASGTPFDSGSTPSPVLDAAPFVDAGNLPDASKEAGPTGITVSGRVLSLQAGLAGARVVIEGKEATSNATGAFSIAGVTVPYTVSVILGADLAALVPPNGKGVTVYSGLSTTSPLLSVDAKVKLSTAELSGTLNGVGTAPADASFDKVIVAPFQDSGLDLGSANVVSVLPARAGSDEFSVKAQWPSDQSSKQVSLVGIRYSSANSLTSFPRFAGQLFSGAEVAAQNGVAKTGLVLNGRSVPLRQASGSIALASGYTQLRRLLRLRGKDGGSFSFSVDDQDPIVDVGVPDSALWPIPEFGVQASFQTGGSAFLYADINVLSGPFAKLEVPPPPLQVAPADQAPFSPSTGKLSWTGPSKCIYDVRLTSQADGSTQVRIFTAATSLTLPDLSPQAAGLTSLASYKWTVACRPSDTQDVGSLVLVKPVVNRGSIVSIERSFLAQ
jgi:hypothetical protein